LSTKHEDTANSELEAFNGAYWRRIEETHPSGMSTRAPDLLTHCLIHAILLTNTHIRQYL
jgi:hypothetical protein